MDEKKRNKLIVGFLQGKLSVEDEKELLDWVNEKPLNRELFMQQQLVSEEELFSQRSFGTMGSWNMLKKRIVALRGNPMAHANYFSLKRIAGIAAAFIIGIILSATIISQWSVSDRVEATQTVATPYGARTHFSLPDGSSVWLNAGSEISYSSKFMKDRQVHLSGEAFFQVKKGSLFSVSTQYGQVQVRGTSFNVKAFDHEKFETTLVTGSVQIKELKSGRELLLKPGFQAIEEERGIVIRKVETNLFTSWKEGKLIFKNEYLPAVAKKLARWYNVTIKLADDSRLSKIYFSGTIEMESFPEVMELLKTTSAINYSFDRDTRTIFISMADNENNHLK